MEINKDCAFIVKEILYNEINPSLSELKIILDRS